jgi:uncharacterized small protein (DUF1192 family)
LWQSRNYSGARAGSLFLPFDELNRRARIFGDFILLNFFESSHKINHKAKKLTQETKDYKMKFLKRKRSQRTLEDTNEVAAKPSKSIFRFSSKSSASLQKLQPSITWSISESSSFHSKDEHCSSEDSNPENLQEIKFQSSLQHIQEIAYLKQEIERLKAENESSDILIHQQETELMQQNKKIQSLNDTIVSTDNKFKVSEKITHEQELDIVTKSDALSRLSKVIQGAASKYNTDTLALQSKLKEKDEEIQSLNEKLEMSHHLVSQTASRLLHGMKRDQSSWSLWNNNTMIKKDI